MPLTREQFEKAQQAGFSTDQIIEFEKQRSKEQEPKMVGSIFGKVSEEDYASGERNILGNIFERPGSAIRSMLMGKGYTAGSVNPTNVPTFQETALDKYYGGEKPSALKVAGGNIVSAAGMAADVATNPADILTMLIPMTKPAQAAGKAIASSKAGQAIKSVVNMPLEQIGRPTAKQVAMKTTKAVKDGIQKAVRPSVIGKKTANQQQAYFKRAEMAVKDVLDNKANIELIKESGEIITGKNPKTINEALQAVGQTKESLFERYSPMIKQASDSGAIVDGDMIAKQLENFAGKESVKLSNPNLSKYAQDVADRWKGQKISLQTAEDTAKEFNAMLKQKYMQGRMSGADVSSAHIDDMVVRALRSEISDKAGIGDLKQRYGALAELERDLAHRAIVTGRQNKVGLAESLINAESAGDILGGVSLSAATGNPAYMGFAVRGAGRKALGSWIKNINSPDANIDRMFKTVEKLRKIQPKEIISSKNLIGILKKATQEEMNVIKSKSTGSSYIGKSNTGSKVGIGQDISKGRKIPSKKGTTTKAIITGSAGVVGVSSQAKAGQDVDMDKIYSIESSNNPNAYNKSSKATGLGQITPIVLKEWNNFHKGEQHTNDDLYDKDINKKISSWYMNKRIPQMLKAFGKEDTLRNRLIAYNAGIRRVGKILPKETESYIRKYNK